MTVPTIDQSDQNTLANQQKYKDDDEDKETHLYKDKTNQIENCR